MGRQQTSGEGGREEFKDNNRLRGGLGASSNRKKLKKAGKAGRSGVHTGTEMVGKRGQKKISGKKAEASLRFRKGNMSRGQGQREERGQVPAAGL